MRETSPGVYTAEYTVRRDDSFSKEKAVVKFETARGERFTVESKDTVGTVGLAPSKPVVTSPLAGPVSGDEITVTGTAPNAQRVEVTVDYSTRLLGILGSKGTLSSTTYDVDKNGAFRTDPLSLKLSLDGKGTEYTITVVGIAADGTRSAAQTIKLTR